jgi:Tfp pilus assembly protein PilX
MSVCQASLRRTGEKGGITILLALILLVLMTTAAFQVSHSTLREIAMSGNESTGRKSTEAADAGIDWVITWLNPGAPSPSTLQAQVSTQVANLEALYGGVTPNVNPLAASDPLPSSSGSSSAEPKYGLLNTTTGVMRIFFRNIDYPSDLSLSAYTNGSNGVSQNSAITQGFDTEIRILGPALNFGTAKGNTYFLLRTIGRANVGSTGQSFIAQREVLMELPRTNTN